MPEENGIIDEVDTGELEDLDAEYAAESPSILTDQELNKIARAFDILPEDMQAIAKNMSKIRRQYSEQDNY